jgi:hypothetical protein
MNKFLLLLALMFCAAFASAQTTYYWVGNQGDSINVTSNWNTVIDGSGTSRSSNTNASDVLVFDGSNMTGVTPFFPVVSTAGITCRQLKFTNNATIRLVRTLTGTTTITVSGDATPNTEDFLIETGSSLTLADGLGSQIITLSTNINNSGRVSGNLAMVTTLQAGIRNGTVVGPTLLFTSGSGFTTNITSASASYAFGNSTQSTEKWVVFESGSHLYYNGGFSPMGSGNLFSAINMKPGSTWHHRATNTTTTGGNFFNRKNFGDVIVENSATLNATGPVYSIENLIVTSGAAFVTHTSGQTVVLGNVTVDGSLTSAAASTNVLVPGGNAPQTISGSGTIDIAGLLVADNADVVLNKSISVVNSASVYGKINFNTSQITGTANFTTQATTILPSLTGNTAAGQYFIAGVAGLTNAYVGQTVTGTGIAANTNVVSYTTALDTIYISQPALSTNTGASFSFSVQRATLQTANANGFNPVSGSVAVAGTKAYGDGINYVINATTTEPFGITTGSIIPYVNIGNLQFNAAATTNITAYVSGTLQATNGKVTIRPLDTLHLLPGANLAGTYNSNVYFVTGVNATGNVGVLTKHNTSGSTLFPVGTPANYLPATINPVSNSYFAINVFQGITTNGTPTGTAFTSLQKQTVVDAVWNVNRLSGSGDANLKLQWTPALEGTTLATFANSEIGIIKNTGSAWTLPFGIGDNVANTADTTFNSFGQFSVGARPPANPFVFNALPPKTYGDADFSPGVISSNTTQPINYSSSNTGVATIVGGNIHIVGTGTTNITATQASDGFYPAANVSQTLTVNKASLTIKADRKIKPEGDPNPPLTATYTGFVLGETQAVLLTPAVLTTTATTASAPGNYLITVSGATAANYSITFVNDSLIVRPRTAQTITFPAFATKTYGNADFGIGASSSNNTIPITYASSNTGVATIVGNNIHIVGAGTTNITASQAGSDLFFPATPVVQTLTVNKAALTVRATDTTKNFGAQNPAFRITYTGFVLGETNTVFTTQPTISTTATTNSAPGYYVLQPTGAVAANYNITYVNGRLTILPASGTGSANLQAFMSNSNNLVVRVYSPEPDLGDVMIYDINGRFVAKKNIFIAPGFISTQFTISGWPSGLYVVQVIGTKTKLKLTIPIFH